MLASDIAALVGGRLEGDDTELAAVAPLDRAGPSDLSFLHAARYADQLGATNAGAVLVAADLTVSCDRPLIRVPDPYAALTIVLEQLYPPEEVPSPGIHPLAWVDDAAVLGTGVSVGPFAVIEHGACIGARSAIGAGVFVGHDASIGADCRLHPGAVVYRRCVLGDRVELLANAVVGSDGFGHSREDGEWKKIPHMGIAVLEDDVLVGAGSTIDRATFGETRIGRGTKIDNLVMVAHNCTVGPNTALAAQAGMAGSTKIGAGVQVGGQAGFSGHITVHDEAVIGAQSGVDKDVEAGTYVFGYPARPYREAFGMLAALSRLPELRKRVRELEQRLADLEDRTG